MAPAAGPRRQLHGYVSEDARTGWYRFAEEHDVNTTALLEAIGLQLGALNDQPANKLPTVLRAALKDAQSIAGQRSTRRRQ